MTKKLSRAGAARPVSITSDLVRDVVAIGWTDVTPDVAEVAKQCLLDWLGVSIAAHAEPLVDQLAAIAAEEAGAGVCTLIARSARAPLSQAVLVNGAMGHALDYDDVITSMGHPTVPVAPVVLALGEAFDRSGRDVLTAFIAGVDAEVRVARLLGPSHYQRGFHGTATYGTFGAAASAGRMLGLDQEATIRAFGIAGTQAAGLKAVFGTMCKPLHAGKAAANGLLAARLAAGGFTSHLDILATEQGFGTTQSDALNPEAALAPPPRGHWVRETLFKYHAACYLTHSAINAADVLRRRQAFGPDQIVAVEVGVDPGHLRVCAIPAPATGLECKFSLTMTTAMALMGENTADDLLFTDATAARTDLMALRDRVVVTGRKARSATLSEVTVRLADGRVLREEADCAVPAEDVEAQWTLLIAKFHSLVDPVLGAQRAAALVAHCRALDTASSVRPLIALAE